MLKVVVVDDELMIRVGFQSCIKWEDYGCEVTACESASDAIVLFKQQVPDLVFTDIMMPEMDGIQLVRYIREHYPRTRIVVLSCVGEVEYVKTAIKLGAEDYILKLSFTREVLTELVIRLKAEIEEDKKSESQEGIFTEIRSFNREETLRMLMAGNLTVLEAESLLDQLGYQYDPFEQYLVGCFLIDGYQPFHLARASGDSDTHIIRYGLLNVIREYLGKLPVSDLVFINEREIMVLFRIHGLPLEDRTVRELLEPLNTALKTHLNLTVSLGIGMDPLPRGGLMAGYRRARKLAELRFFGGSGSLYIGELNGGEPNVTRRSVQKGIQEAVFRQEAEVAVRLTNQWFDRMKASASYEQIDLIRRSVVETWIFISGYIWPENVVIPEYDDMYSLSDFWEAETLEELKFHFKAAVRTILDYLQANKSANPEIMCFLKYLEEHVDENISLDSAARHCALGKSQFCILFKKITGETFINYFNRIRMKRAYSLLGIGGCQVQEAANLVGMKDISYFSRMFKKYNNVNPSDVRKL